MKAERAQQLRMAIDRLPLSTRRAMLQGMERNRIIVGADASLSGLCPILAASGSAQQVGRPFARAWDRYARARLPRAATERELLTLRSMLVSSIEREQTSPFPLRGAIVSHQVAQRRNRPARSGVARSVGAQEAMDAVSRRKAAQDARREAAQDARDAAREVRHALADLRRTSREPQPEPEPEPEPEIRYSADYLRPAARVAAAKAEAYAKADARARAKAQAEAEASRRRPARTGERDHAWELVGRDGWSWLRPFRRYDDYEAALLELERELEAVERRPDAGLAARELIPSSSGRS
jgi:hypothetical protein